MIHLLTKLYRYVTSIFRKSKPVSLELLLKEIELIKEAQAYLVQFYQLELKKSTDQYKAAAKIVLAYNTKFDDINKLINQHADTINGFLSNYKAHIMDPSAHVDSDDLDEPKPKKREDN